MLILMSITEDGFSILTLIPPPKEKNNNKKRRTWGFNPLSPNIHLQILQTDLHTFP